MRLQWMCRQQPKVQASCNSQSIRASLHLCKSCQMYDNASLLCVICSVLSRLSVGCFNVHVAGPSTEQTYQLFATEWNGAAERPLPPTSRSSLADLSCPALRWPPPAPCSWPCWRCWRPLPPPDLRPAPRARCCCCRRLTLSCTFTRVREGCGGSSVAAVQVCCTAGIAGVPPLAADGHDDARGLGSRATASA